jgi:ubiquinone/menaquinone biosynthesis C-methylase UbiE
MSGMETMDIKKNVIEPDIYGDIQYCPEIPDETYNGVIMVGIWELLKEPQYALFEIMRILKKDGKLLFGFPPRTLEKFEVIYYKSNEPVYLLGTIKKNEY